MAEKSGGPLIKPGKRTMTAAGAIHKSVKEMAKEAREGQDRRRKQKKEDAEEKRKGTREAREQETHETTEAAGRQTFIEKGKEHEEAGKVREEAEKKRKEAERVRKEKEKDRKTAEGTRALGEARTAEDIKAVPEQAEIARLKRSIEIAALNRQAELGEDPSAYYKRIYESMVRGDQADAAATFTAYLRQQPGMEGWTGVVSGFIEKADAEGVTWWVAMDENGQPLQDESGDPLRINKDVLASDPNISGATIEKVGVGGQAVQVAPGADPRVVAEGAPPASVAQRQTLSEKEKMSYINKQLGIDPISKMEEGSTEKPTWIRQRIMEKYEGEGGMGDFYQGFMRARNDYDDFQVINRFRKKWDNIPTIEALQELKRTKDKALRKGFKEHYGYIPSGY